jgi:hypothetical protein
MWLLRSPLGSGAGFVAIQIDGTVFPWRHKHIYCAIAMLVNPACSRGDGFSGIGFSE